MAPLPANNTNRLFIDYTANGREHTVSFRYTGPAAPPSASFLEGVDDFLIACNAYMPSNWAFIGWRYQAVGTNFSVPMTGSPTAFAGEGTPHASESPAFFSAIGRSEGGRRNRVYLLGASVTPSSEEGVWADYRVYASEDADAAAILAAVSGMDLVAVDDLQTNWKEYLNIGLNSYWQRKARG